MLVLPRKSSTGLVFEATCWCRSNNQLPLKLTTELVPEGLKVEITDDSQVADPGWKTVRVSCKPTKNGIHDRELRHQIHLRANTGQIETTVELTVVIRQ